MSRFTAASDWDYFEECNRPAKSVEMHCRDCGAVVYVCRDDYDSVPRTLQCAECERRQDEREAQGAA